MAHTTDDCKEFLVKKYPKAKMDQWKRGAKYKDAQGSVCRDFSNKNSILTVCVKETQNGLIEVGNTVPQKYNTLSIAEMVFGGGKTSTANMNTAQEKFLHVMENGIDWSAPEHERASVDFAAHIDFKSFVASEPELLNDYLEYMHSAVAFISDLDESDMPHYIIESNYDDTMVDLINVLDKIISVYDLKNYYVESEHITNIFSSIDDINGMIDYSDSVQEKKAKKVMTKLTKKLNALI